MRHVFSTAALCAVLTLSACDMADSAGEAMVVGDVPTSSAHESNNRADLTGDGITGSAIVNYAKGAPAEWRSTVSVQGLAAGAYTFAVTLNGGNQTTVCTFTSDGNGSAGCSADTDLPGFNTGVILNSDGRVVASGTFARRGGQRIEGGQGAPPLSAVLTGAAEVPGPGDPDGRGTATVTLNPGQGEVCFELSVTGIAPATAAHIHEAPAGVAGPVVVGLTAPTGGASSGCVTVSRKQVAEINANPSAYYVNVHNEEFRAGAVRGQLSK